MHSEKCCAFSLVHKTWNTWENKVGRHMTRSSVIVTSLKERLGKCHTWQQENNFISAHISFPGYKSNWLPSQSKFGDSQLVNVHKWLCKHKVVITRELSLLHYCLLNNQELNFSLNIYKREGSTNGPQGGNYKEQIFSACTSPWNKLC